MFMRAIREHIPEEARLTSPRTFVAYLAMLAVMIGAALILFLRNQPRRRPPTLPSSRLLIAILQDRARLGEENFRPASSRRTASKYAASNCASTSRGLSLRQGECGLDPFQVQRMGIWTPASKTFQVLFPTPKERIVRRNDRADENSAASCRNRFVPGDPDLQSNRRAAADYNAYSIDGDVTAPWST